MLLEEFDVEKYERTLREEGIEEGVRVTIEILQELGQTREFTKSKLIEKYSLSEQDAEGMLMEYWKEESLISPNESPIA